MLRAAQLSYEPEQERWCVALGIRRYGLHCGECFSLHLGNSSHVCRLELDTQWYVVIDETKLILHTRMMYSIDIDA